MEPLAQNVATTVLLGPLTNKTTGDPITGATVAAANVKYSVDGGAWTTAGAGATHTEDGWYSHALTPGTVGRLKIKVAGITDQLFVANQFQVMTEAKFNDTYGGSAKATANSVLDALTSAHTVANSFGKLIQDQLDATVSSRSSHAAADVWTVTTRGLTTAANITSDGVAITSTLGTVNNVASIVNEVDANVASWQGVAIPGANMIENFSSYGRWRAEALAAAPGSAVEVWGYSGRTLTSAANITTAGNVITVAADGRVEANVRQWQNVDLGTSVPMVQNAPVQVGGYRWTESALSCTPRYESWNWSQADYSFRKTTTGTMSSGTFRLNNATPSAATEIVLNKNTIYASNIENIILKELLTNDAVRWNDLEYRLTGPPVPGLSNNYTIPVSHISGSNTGADDTVQRISFGRTAPFSVDANVIDVTTDALRKWVQVDTGLSTAVAGSVADLSKGSGGSGDKDWTDAEREQIRYQIGIDGTQTAPATNTPNLATAATTWAFATRELTSAAKITSSGGEISVTAGKIDGVALVDVTTANTDRTTPAQVWQYVITNNLAAAGSDPTAEQALAEALFNLAQKSNAGTTQSVRRADGTVAGTYTLDDANNPTSKIRAT